MAVITPADMLASKVQVRFLYEHAVYGEWTDVLTDHDFFPNPGHIVACIEFRIVGPGGNEVSALSRSPRNYSYPKRGKRVPNGRE